MTTGNAQSDHYLVRNHFLPAEDFFAWLQMLEVDMQTEFLKFLVSSSEDSRPSTPVSTHAGMMITSYYDYMMITSYFQMQCSEITLNSDWLPLHC